MKIHPQFSHRTRPELRPVLNETETNVEPGPIADAFGDDALLDLSRKDQHGAFRASLFERGAHHRVEQLLEHHLA